MTRGIRQHYTAPCRCGHIRASHCWTPGKSQCAIDGCFCAAFVEDDESWVYPPAPPVGSVEESVRDDAQWERDDEPHEDEP